VAGGLSSAQGLAIVRGLRGVNLIGADVVEVAPAYDHSEITAIGAAHIACDLLCLWRQQRKYLRSSLTKRQFRLHGDMFAPTGAYTSTVGGTIARSMFAIASPETASL
jgi:hypothetical protein